MTKRFHEAIQMKKKKQVTQTKLDDKPMTLGDMLTNDIMEQLKGKKQELKAVEDKQKDEEEQRKKEERRRKEKNKSFEELLGESDLNWQKFK